MSRKIYLPVLGVWEDIDDVTLLNGVPRVSSDGILINPATGLPTTAEQPAISGAYLAAILGDSGAGLPVDVSGAGNHATFGATLTRSLAWRTPGAMSSTHTSDSGGAILLPPAVAALDFAAGESWLMMLELNPESGLVASILGNWPTAGIPGIRVTMTGGVAFRPGLSDGAHNVSVATNKVLVSANAWNQVCIAIDGVTKQIHTFLAGQVANVLDASAVTGSTVNTTHYFALGHAGKRISGTTNDPTASWLLGIRNLHILKFGAGLGLPGTLPKVIAQWAATPSALLTVADVGV